MSAPLHLFPQGIEREDDDAAVIGPVEVSRLLLNCQLAQRVLDKLLGGAGVVIAFVALLLGDAGRRDAAV